MQKESLNLGIIRIMPMIKNAKVKNRFSLSLRNIILFITFILSTSFLYPKGIDVCLSGGIVLQNTEDYLQVNSFGVKMSGFPIGAIQFSYKDLIKGVHPFIRLVFDFQGKSELVGLSVSYRTLFMSGGLGKHFKIETCYYLKCCFVTPFIVSPRLLVPFYLS